MAAQLVNISGIGVSLWSVDQPEIVNRKARAFLAALLRGSSFHKAVLPKLFFDGNILIWLGFPAITAVIRSRFKFFRTKGAFLDASLRDFYFVHFLQAVNNVKENSKSTFLFIIGFCHYLLMNENSLWSCHRVTI
jgi:hypothetical protein